MRSKLQRLKSNLWVVFSEYIRRQNADEDGLTVCISCGKSDDWKNLDAGHYIPKTYGLSIYFEERNVHPQCLTKESNIKMFNGSHKSIGDIRKGDFIWAFNEVDFSLQKAVVEKTSSFIPEILYEVELQDGRKFYATGDHRVVSKGKWISVEDMLHNVSAHSIMER